MKKLIIFSVMFLNAYYVFGAEEYKLGLNSDYSESNARSIKAYKQKDNMVVINQKLNDLQEEIQQLRGLIEAESHKLQQLLLKKQLSENSDIALTPNSNAEQEATVPDVDSDKDDYTKAYQIIMLKKYKHAESALLSFVDRYPDSDYLPNAYYWLGELMLKKADYKNALKHFDLVTAKYPESPKVADSMYKKALIYIEQGKNQLAQTLLKGIKNKYPDSSTAILAQNKLESLQENN